MKRKLNDIEYLNFSIGQPYNLAVALKMKGRITKEELKCALKRAQDRHPLLKARIETDENGTNWLTSENVQEIPIEEVKLENDSITNELFLDHLEKPFDYKKKNFPLFRVTLLTSKEQTHLILCAQHTIADGLSMVFLIRDLIDFINKPEEEIVSLTAPSKTEDIFSPKIRKKIPESYFRTRIALFLMRIYYFLKFGKKKEDIIHADEYREDDLRLISWSLNEEETNLFLLLCKKNGISVHTAICTLFLPDIPIINTPVNLRGRLAFPIDEAFGLYAGGTVIKGKYKRSKSFWKNAKKYQRKLYLGLKDRKVFKIHKMVHTGVPLGILQEFAPLFIEIAGNQEAFAITNLGSLDRLGIKLDSENFSIESFYGSISFAIGAITVLVYTMRGQMSFHFHYLESRHDNQRMKKISENAQRRIKEILLAN